MKKRPHITEKTKIDLADAFWILSKEKDFEKITVSDVIKKAGYNRTTFYRYFENVSKIQEYAESLLSPELSINANQMKAHFANLDWQGMHKDFLAYSNSNKYRIAAYLSKYQNHPLQRQFERSMGPLFCPAYNKLSDKDKSRFQFILSYHVAGMLCLSANFLKNNQGLSREELYALSTDLQIHGTIALMQKLVSE